MLRVKENAAFFARCLGQTRSSARQGAIDQALAWASCTGKLGWKAHPGFYASPELEIMLQEVGQKIPDRSINNRTKKPTKGRRWLHVMTAAHHTGGHTRFVEKWIQRQVDLNEDQHSIVILDQGRDSIPDWLDSIVKTAGGKIEILSSSFSLAEKAVELRTLVRCCADVVVLHVHPNDPVPAVAFAVDDLPPILFLNHADHVFCTGIGIADQVVDIRRNGQMLTRHRRTARNLSYLPIPLIDKQVGSLSLSRQRLNLPLEKVIVLSIGGPYKYVPYSGLNFIKVGMELCRRHENVMVLAIGPSPKQPEWQQASEKTGGRFRALGSFPGIEDYYNACDIYLDSFPIGSLTASLDAALYGKPIVMSPCRLLPFLGIESHYEGLPDSLPTVDAYLEYLGRMISDAQMRKEASFLQRQSISDLHAGSGWTQCLEKLIEGIPTRRNCRILAPEEIGVTNEEDAIWAELQATFWPSVHKTFRGALRNYKKILGPLAIVSNRSFSYFQQGKFDLLEKFQR